MKVFFIIQYVKTFVCFVDTKKGTEESMEMITKRKAMYIDFVSFTTDRRTRENKRKKEKKADEGVN